MQSDEYGDVSNKGQLHISMGCFPCGCLRAVWPGERGMPRAACDFQLAGSPARGQRCTAGDGWLGMDGQGHMVGDGRTGQAAFPRQGDGLTRWDDNLPGSPGEVTQTWSPLWPRELLSSTTAMLPPPTSLLMPGGVPESCCTPRPTPTPHL